MPQCLPSLAKQKRASVKPFNSLGVPAFWKQVLLVPARTLWTLIVSDKEQQDNKGLLDFHQKMLFITGKYYCSLKRCEQVQSASAHAHLKDVWCSFKGCWAQSAPPRVHTAWKALPTVTDFSGTNCTRKGQCLFQNVKSYFLICLKTSTDSYSYLWKGKQNKKGKGHKPWETPGSWGLHKPLM